MMNAHLLIDEGTGAAALVDPGDELPTLLNMAKEADAKIEMILGTHGHLDHIGAVALAQEALKVPFYLHKEDEVLLENLPQQARMFGMPVPKVPKVDHFLAHGDKVQMGETILEVRHAPGHSPGSVCFYDGEHNVVVGDVLFQGSIGRSDLMGGNGKQLIESIHAQLMTLPDEILVHSGHGPVTTIGQERQTNPFVRGLMSIF